MYWRTHKTKATRIVSGLGSARRGTAYGHKIYIAKTYTLDDDGLVCEYLLRSETNLVVHFASELNVTMLAGRAEDRYYSYDGLSSDSADRYLDSRGFIPQASLALVNHWDQFSVRITAEGDAPAGLWRYPIETVSQSEDGSERLYQGSCVLPWWKDVRLGPSRDFRATVRVTFSHVPAQRR